MGQGQTALQVKQCDTTILQEWQVCQEQMEVVKAGWSGLEPGLWEELDPGREGGGGDSEEEKSDRRHDRRERS